ncbi:MAG: riboflavin synthase [Pseudomonadota bacterium]
MFTGIITDVGTILKLEQKGDLYARIATAYAADQIDIGASIACNGICLTVTAKGVDGDQNWFDVDISAETVAKTNINAGRRAWAIGNRINLERALRLGDELGGHLVSGHVDTTATITKIEDSGDSSVVTFDAPAEFARFIAPKGSVTLDGIALTVNHVDGASFDINLIPHTKAQTAWDDLQSGDIVNLEIDTLARYVARLVETQYSGGSFKPASENIEIA